MAFELPLWLQASVVGDQPLVNIPARLDRVLLGQLFPLEGALVDPGPVATLSGLTVAQRAAGANMSVDVSAGVAIVQCDTLANAGKYFCSNNSVANVAVPAAPGSGTRTHRIVAQVHDKQSDGGTTYAWAVELVADTGGGLPQEPSNAITLATVAVTAGQLTVTTANIADMRTPVAAGNGGVPVSGFSWTGNTGASTAGRISIANPIGRIPKAFVAMATSAAGGTPTSIVIATHYAPFTTATTLGLAIARADGTVMPTGSNVSGYGIAIG